MILAGWQERVFSGVGRRLRDIILDRRESVGHYFGWLEVTGASGDGCGWLHCLVMHL